MLGEGSAGAESGMVHPFGIYMLVCVIFSSHELVYKVLQPTLLCIVIATGNLASYIIFELRVGIARDEIKTNVAMLYALTPLAALAEFKGLYMGFLVFAADVGLSYLITALYMLNNIFKYIFLEKRLAP